VKVLSSEDLRSIESILEIKTQEIEKKLNGIKKMLDKIEEKMDRIMAPVRAASLPDRLRTTMNVLIELGEATASQVAERTGRTRVAESTALNELTRLGFVEKRRKGREVYFKQA